MTDFYVAASKKIVLPNGQPFALRKGIHAIPDALASHTSANEHGIKPVGEMTDAEWRGLGYTAAERRQIEERHGLVAKTAEPAPVAADPDESPDIITAVTPAPVVPGTAQAAPAAASKPD